MNPESIIDADVVVGEIVDRVRRRFAMKPKVAFAGFGKSGKSSLFNAVYGEKVAPVSMTTDETVENSTKERFGIDFTDTPGFGTEKFTLDAIAKRLDGQHVVVHVLNGASAVSADDTRLHKMLTPSKRITVVNKVDTLLTKKADKRPEYASSMKQLLGLGPDQFLFVSAEEGTNVRLLVHKIAEMVPAAMMDAFIAQQQADAEIKATRIRKLIYSKATLAATVGATPIPIADIIIITPIQVAMVAGIGYFHGIEVSKDRALEFMGVVAAGVGLREIARQLVKLIPGVGPAISAAIAFAGTVALGKAADAWFKSQMKMDADDLRQVFRHAAAQAKEEYKPEDFEASPEVQNRVAEVREQRQSGKITETEMLTALGKLETGL